MPLTFSNPPFVKEPPLAVWLQGRDDETGESVDVRIFATTLTKHFGAKGITNHELLRAFEEHHDEMVRAARRKYAAEQFERLDDRIVVWL